MEAWFWLPVVAGIGWLLFKAGESKAQSAQAEMQRQSSLRRAFAEPVEDATGEAESRKAKAAAKSASDWEASAASNNYAAQKDTREKIEKARKLVKDAGLDRALPKLWEKVRYWPSWINLPDRWSPPLDVSEISGTKQGEQEAVSWEWRDNQFQLIHTKKHNYTPDYDYNPAELSLVFNGKTVMTAACQRHHSEYGSDLTYSDIEALTVGEWMTEVVELQAGLELASRESLRASLTDLERQKASRMDLGD